jgi:hypothetical protein
MLDEITQDLFHQLIQGDVTFMCQFHELVPLVVIKFNLHCGTTSGWRKVHRVVSVCYMIVHSSAPLTQEILSGLYISTKLPTFTAPSTARNTTNPPITANIVFILQLHDWGVWVDACTLFWAVPHGHETASPDQTVLDVDADVVVAVQKILAS